MNYGDLIREMRLPSWIFDTRNTVNKEIAKNFGFKVWKLGDGSSD